MPPLLSFLLSPIQVAPKLRYGIAQRVAVGVFGVGFLVLFVNVRRETGQIGCFDLLGSKGLPCPVTLAHHCCIANHFNNARLQHCHSSLYRLPRGGSVFVVFPRSRC